MAYQRDDEAVAEYEDLERQLETVKAGLAEIRRNISGAADLYGKRLSIEKRMAELKANCHLLQR